MQLALDYYLNKIYMFDTINHYLRELSSSKYFIGLAMIFLNLASRFFELRLSPGQEHFIKSIGREVLIFTIAFMGTRDIVTSFILTGIFILLANFVFNEESKYCVLPEKYKQMSKALDINNDGVVSQTEIENAINVLQKAKRQDNLNNQMSMMGSLEHNNTEAFFDNSFTVNIAATFSPGLSSSNNCTIGLPLAVRVASGTCHAFNQ